MSIKSLVENIDSPNLAKDLDEQVLMKIGARVKRQYDEDMESMNDWVDSVKHGIDLMQQEYKPKDTPWQGASNYKDPILTEASIKFGDKATLELLRPEDLVSCGTIGKDPEGQKKEICGRVTEAMNFQVNHELNDGNWREEHGRSFYCLPNVGAAFKKVVYDPVEETTDSVLVTYPDFAVNQATKSMEKCRSFSHMLDLSHNEVWERVQCGKWLDPYDEAEGEETEGDKGSNEAEGVEHAADNEDKFIEQQCYYDLDEDGYEEPYTVTIYQKTCKPVRIIPRYDEQSIIVRYRDKIMPLNDALDAEKALQAQQFGGKLADLVGIKPPEIDPDSFELIKIVPFQNIVKYGFIPAPDGTFLDYGYAHLLGALTQAMNTGTNQLIDRATLNNVGGGFLSKEFRKETGVVKRKMGRYQKTGIPAKDLANGIYDYPHIEPSQTLYTMVQDMLGRSTDFLALVDMSGKLNAQTAPTTALMMVQEAIIPTSALFKRIIDSMTKEFEVLFRINQRTMTAEKYSEILGVDGNPEEFSIGGISVFPTANAEMSSKMQRIQTAEIEYSKWPDVLQAGGNPVPIIKNFFESIGSQLSEQIFPDEGSMSPQEQEQLKKMREAQELQNQIAQLQLSILQREQDRLDRETDDKIRKTSQEIENMRAELVETLTSALLNTEKAETEQVTNMINDYSARISGFVDTLSAIGAEHDRRATIQAQQVQGHIPSTIQ